MVQLRDLIDMEDSSDARNLFFCMTLCHTAIVQRIKRGSQHGFISESEDELALLSSAKQIGFSFLKRTDKDIYVSAFKEKLVFRMIGMFPFDPERRIMSIIVESETNETIMFSKGADSSMFNICKL